jgi:hypothetical protein
MFKKYLLYSSVFSLFSEALLFHYIIDFKFFYIVILLNSGLLIYYRLYHINKIFLLLSGVFFALNIFNILLGLNQWYLFAMQFSGIVIIANYYYNFFRYLNDDSFVFKTYVKTSFWVASVGIIIFLTDIIYYGEIVRLESIMHEPAHYANAVLPALYFSLWNFINYKTYKKETAILLVSIIFAGSSIGFIGLLLTILFIGIGKKSMFKIFLTFSTVILLGFIIYITNSDVSLRVDDTFRVLKTMDFAEANLSTFALLSNAYVSYHNFLDYPIFGSGLGSYQLAYQEYFYTIDGVEDFSEAFNINSKDASSLFLRVLAENGLFGMLTLLSFIMINIRGLDFKSKAISYGLLVYICLKLLRGGHYFTPEMWFFFMLFYFLHRNRRTSLAMTKVRPNFRTAT